MIDPHLALSFDLASVVFVVIPGPSVLFTTSRGVALGRRAAVLTVLGNSAGVYLQVIAVAAGIGPVIERSAAAYNGLKLAGALYLVWLGIEAIRHRRSLTDALGVAVEPKSPRRIVREGFVVGITNPKGIVFWTAILPQFIDPGRAAAPVRMLLLGLISLTIAVVSDSTYDILAGNARQWFSRSPRRLERARPRRPRLDGRLGVEQSLGTTRRRAGARRGATAPRPSWRRSARIPRSRRAGPRPTRARGARPPGGRPGAR